MTMSIPSERRANADATTANTTTNNETINVNGGDADRDFDLLRENYEQAVDCLVQCEYVIKALREQLASKDERISVLEEDAGRVPEILGPKVMALQERVASKDERIRSLEGEIVRMSLELASSKAERDEEAHRFKRRISEIRMEGGVNGSNHGMSGSNHSLGRGMNVNVSNHSFGSNGQGGGTAAQMIVDLHNPPASRCNNRSRTPNPNSRGADNTRSRRNSSRTRQQQRRQSSSSAVDRSQSSSSEVDTTAWNAKIKDDPSHSMMTPSTKSPCSSSSTNRLVSRIANHFSAALDDSGKSDGGNSNNSNSNSNGANNAGGGRRHSSPCGVASSSRSAQAVAAPTTTRWSALQQQQQRGSTGTGTGTGGARRPSARQRRSSSLTIPAKRPALTHMRSTMNIGQLLGLTRTEDNAANDNNDDADDDDDARGKPGGARRRDVPIPVPSPARGGLAFPTSPISGVIFPVSSDDCLSYRLDASAAHIDSSSRSSLNGRKNNNSSDRDGEVGDSANVGWLEFR